jgi:hypothetical protein
LRSLWLWDWEGLPGGVRSPELGRGGRNPGPREPRGLELSGQRIRETEPGKMEGCVGGERGRKGERER